jgi:hypothetical protein
VERWALLNILNYTVILKRFGKPLLQQQGKQLACCATQGAVQLHHFSGCDAVIVYIKVEILILLLSRINLQYFLKVFCRHLPYSVEVVSHILHEDNKENK